MHFASTNHWKEKNKLRVSLEGKKKDETRGKEEERERKWTDLRQQWVNFCVHFWIFKNYIYIFAFKKDWTTWYSRAKERDWEWSCNLFTGVYYRSAFSKRQNARGLFCSAGSGMRYRAPFRETRIRRGEKWWKRRFTGAGRWIISLGEWWMKIWRMMEHMAIGMEFQSLQSLFSLPSLIWERFSDLRYFAFMFSSR